jgi:hypothetical protein
VSWIACFIYNLEDGFEFLGVMLAELFELLAVYSVCVLEIKISTNVHPMSGEFGKMGPCCCEGWCYADL